MMDYSLRRSAVVVWKWTDSPTMDCPDVCLKALWLQEWQWVLEDCHKKSCWKNPIGVGVPRPCGSDVYVCSKSFRLCLTVVYWLQECNKVPSWIENPEYVTVLCEEYKLWSPSLPYSIFFSLLLLYPSQVVYIQLEITAGGFERSKKTKLPISLKY
jgi:hypothetical protein